MAQDPRIETVARAMCRAMGQPEDHAATDRTATGMAAADPPWKDFERQARLAIAAHDALQGKPPRRVRPSKRPAPDAD